MPVEPPPRPSDENVAAELDAAHERARRAYADRDAQAYVELFHPDLRYTQHDGRIIGREQLARDVRQQLARVRTATTEFRRETLEVSGPDAATEVLEQRATVEVRAFGVVRRVWSVRRRGRYGWVRAPAGWQLHRVEVLAEEVERVRTGLAFG